MTTSDTLRDTRIRLNHGSVLMPAAGFGTLIPDPLATKQATKAALEVGFRHFDCAERYRNEEAVGDAMQEVFKAGTVRREDVFVTTKLWNANHRPERVKPAFDASRRRTEGRLYRLLYYPYPLCLQTRRRAGSEGRAGSGSLRFRRYVTGDMAGAGAPRGRGALQVDRLIGYYVGEVAGDRFGCADQALSGAGGIPSVSPRMGAARFLPGARDRAAGVLQRWDMPWSQN